MYLDKFHIWFFSEFANDIMPNNANDIMPNNP